MKNFSFSQNWWQFLIIAVVCYFIGCFNFALLISRRKKRDITKIGSGNPGTMNMTREFGLKVGLTTFFCDAIKGGVPAIIGYFLYKGYFFEGTLLVVSDFVRYFCGLFVVIGHIFPVTMKFKGGKGIASTLGLFWACLSCENPWWILIAFAYLLFVVAFIFWTEWGSLGSLLGVSGFSVIQTVIFFLRYGNYPVNAYLVCLYMIILTINVLTWAAHKQNLSRLFSGEEHHTSIKKLAKKKRG
ncbi:MAG: glycerol-3-phosphate acyltransferase [Clostridia bacterium]|nr:glycerol-3-phosphate acyltransferase [Clostridia bacterium]